MAEFKRVFSKAKMNKDYDERIVPNGEYRDANNIEISTSEGSEVGTAQTLLGNTARNTLDAGTFNNVFDQITISDGINTNLGPHNNSTVVGVIAQPDSDAIYYMVSAGDFDDTANLVTGDGSKRKDYILKYNTVSKLIKYVFVDIYQANHKVSGAVSNSTTILLNNNSGDSANDETGVRPGMRLVSTDNNYTVNSDIKVTNVEYSSGDSKWKVTVDQNVTLSNNNEIEFIAERVLNFNKETLITGINIVDDFLFWTDNETEPKKINIPRSMAGTGGLLKLNTVPTDIFNGDRDYHHTRLVRDRSYYSNGNRYEIVTTSDESQAVYVEEQHVTVIKKAPTQPLELKMYRGSSVRIDSNGDETPTFAEDIGQSFMDNTDNETLEAGAELSVAFESEVDFRVGDIILFRRQDATWSPDAFEEYDIRAEVIESNVDNADNLFSTGFTIKILSISSSLTGSDLNWYVRIEDKDPLFQYKFPRFSYRYKYQDGEYSPFAPFSQIAFLPDNYEYHPKKGYNLGMVNQLRSLKLSYYHYNEETIPQDVVEIDLLYKEAGSPTVYTVKTIKRADNHPNWPDLVNGDGDKRGEFDVTTDMIYSVVPANQILRPYDNVPRKALAQEISANRIIYGNYLQNYTVLNDPNISVGFEQETLSTLDTQYAYPSVKSMRKYQVGVVFSDKYGRETPVLTTKSATISVGKDASDTRNRITAQLSSNNNIIPSWADYYSFYIKETSVQYYTLAQDRWYNAADGNIWLSFPSSERNKIDIDTYLVLKKAHGTDHAVKEKTRYKVLAIESEAPEFIKTDKFLVGVFVNGSNSYIGNNEEGFPLQDTTFFDINKQAFDSTFGESFLIDIPDRLAVTFRSGVNAAEYDITKIVLLNEQTYRIHIQGVFSDEISWITTADTFATAVDDIIFELYDNRVKNKPEFDGRFFVKIYRDDVVNTHIVGNTVSQEVTVGKSKKIKYIANGCYSNQVANSTVPTYARYYNNAYGEISGNTANHPTEYAHIVSVESQTAYTWGGSLSSSSYGVPNSAILYNPINAINYGEYSKVFWDKVANPALNGAHLFIDACSAYSLTGRFRLDSNDDINADAPGNVYNVGSGQFTGLEGNITESEITGVSNHAAPFGGQQFALGAIKPGKGQPSRGVWGPNSSYIDISFPAMLGGVTETGALDGDVPQMVSQSESILINDIESFMLELCNPGTVFRFRNDPDEVQYTVQGGFTSEGAYNDNETYQPGVSRYTGVWGIRNYIGEGSNNNKRKMQHFETNIRQRWTIIVSPGVGSGPSGYNPITGTKSVSQGGPSSSDDNFRRALHHDYSNADVIELLDPYYGGQGSNYTENPAVWETEPKESVDLDIYYQASGLIPLTLNDKTSEEYIPIGSTFTLSSSSDTTTSEHTVTAISSNTITFTPSIGSNVTAPSEGDTVKFTKRGNYSMNVVCAADTASSDTTMDLRGGVDTYDEASKLAHQKQFLDWNNCWCFGNGVESDRVRDSFNAPQMDNGVKASSIVSGQVREERRKHGMIFSGIYNSNSGVNNLNQFIAAEAITKDLNPVYGSIQRLINRNTRLIMFCEDKVLRADTNKDLLFNADGNSQVVASNRVIGSAFPYTEKYGVSKNPESIVTTPSNIYFTDASRGRVLALSNSGDGIRVISAKGMKDYFSDIFESYVHRAIGTYDARKNDYNLTITKKYASYQPKYHEAITATYSESSDGWVSFKSFIPQLGISLNNSYYTFHKGQLYEHHTNDKRNNFYDTQYTSDITVLFNDDPGSVKGFTTINYEGSQANIPAFTDVDNVDYFTGDYSTNDGLVDTDNVTDGEYFNLTEKKGWYTSNVTTNLQTCGNVYYKNKEDKYFAYPTGEATSISNLDEKEFTVQGIGLADISHDSSGQGNLVTLTFANNTSSSYQGDDGGGGTWDGSVAAFEALKWSATSQSITVEAGAVLGSQTIEMPISSIIDGVYSGFPIEASKMKIGGATNLTSNIWIINSTDANVDGNQSLPMLYQGTLTFSDSTPSGYSGSLAGSPDNVVTATFTLNPSFVAPSSDTTYYLDIDEIGNALEEVNTRTACIETVTDIKSVSVEAAPTVTDVSNVTETTLQNSGTLRTQHSATVGDNVSTKVAELTFTRAGTSYFADGNAAPYVQYENLGDYEGYYTETIAPTYTSGLMTSFVVKIFYTPPSSGSKLQDITDMCTLGHKAIIHRTVRTPDTVGVGITSVEYDDEIPSIGGTQVITVHGAANAEYDISLQKKQALDSDTTAATNGYYNFETDQFQTASYTLEDQTIGARGGRTSHYVILPEVTDDTRFDITITTTESTGTNVPTAAGDASIIQRGIRTMTVKCRTFTASDFGSLPTLDVVRPNRFDSDSGFYKGITTPNPIYTTGGNGSRTDNRIILSHSVPGLKVGMYVANPFGNLNIPHETKITNIDGLAVTVSNDIVLANGSDLVFMQNMYQYQPFSLTVPAGSGKTLTLSSAVLDELTLPAGINRTPTTKVDGAVGSGTTIILDSTDHIEANMFMDVVDSSSHGSLPVQVTSVDSLTQITVASAITVANDLEVNFGFNNPHSVSVVALKTRLSSGDLVIEGYLRVNSIGDTSDCSINIDNLVTVSP